MGEQTQAQCSGDEAEKRGRLFALSPRKIGEAGGGGGGGGAEETMQESEWQEGTAHFNYLTLIYHL